jgi:crotonobetainyl-CoA:carnitine CoA-transferase CaiB-like acyl-CoA transferase
VVSGVNDGSGGTAAAPGPLTGVRVLEIGDDAAEYCGKLLGDMGAEVVKVEPPYGARSRHTPPFWHDAPDVNSSLSFWHYNTNKLSVVINPDSPDGQHALRSLAATCDVLVEGVDGEAANSGHPGPEQLTSQLPKLIYVRISPFGTAGPWAHFKSSDLVQLALGGTMAMSGYDDLADHESYPIAPSGGQADHMAGVMAAVGAVAALNFRMATGRGQLVDLAVHDVVSISNELGIPYWEFQKANIWCHTGRHASAQQTRPREMFRCMDGKYVVCMTKYIDSLSQFRVLVDWLDSHGSDDDLGEAAYESGVYRIEMAGHIANVIERFCAKMYSWDVFHEAQLRSLPWGPVNEPWELAADPHISTDRGAVVPVCHPEHGQSYVYPGAPYKFSGTPWSIRKTAPNLGADTVPVLRSVGLSPVEIVLAYHVT